jgi:hypothetical protein
VSADLKKHTFLFQEQAYVVAPRIRVPRLRACQPELVRANTAGKRLKLGDLPGRKNAPDNRDSVSIEPNAAEWIVPALQRYVGAGMASAAISASRRCTGMPASAAQVDVSTK